MTTPDMTPPQEAKEPRKAASEYGQLLASLLRQRKESGKGGSPAQQASWRRRRAALRRGSSPHTESYAYPYVLPYIGGISSPTRKSVAIQLAALLAEFDKIPIFEKGQDPEKKTEWRDFGTWCNLVSRALAAEHGSSFELDPDNPDIIAQRLSSLATLDTFNAIATVRRIMAIACRLPNPPALDYWDLFYTFFHWGKGFTTASLNVRRRPLMSYYSAAPAVSPDRDVTATEQ